ncbi:hypothetical protein BB8028_0003g04440 [Beauveria bassiana]|uniref:Uncharacterized protein n=1 Tax=Beauveria bassiana TaxID=176275 RepID=A0A2S7Y6P0_BEABA|nr:hypothetical protein BB8028_0003g04440 [Beauveria bassiana]
MFGQWPSSPEGPAHMVWRDYSDREIYAGARASAANSAALLINPKKDWESEEQYPRWRVSFQAFMAISAENPEASRARAPFNPTFFFLRPWSHGFGQLLNATAW